MTDLKCIGNIKCPNGKAGRIYCRDYQRCLDKVIIKLLSKYDILTSLFKIREMLNEGENHEYGLSDQIIFSRIYNVCVKNNIKIDLDELDKALSFSDIDRIEKMFIRKIFEEVR